jgi:hypothetical protein
MALEMYVVSPRKLSSIAEWQNAADDLQFPIKFSSEIQFESVQGFLPVIWKGRNTGFECNHWTVEDIRESVGDLKFESNFKYVLAFRWIGDFSELVSALQAAAAYAVATDGVVFDCEGGELNSANRSVDIARETEVALPELEAAMNKALDEFRPKK